MRYVNHGWRDAGTQTPMRRIEEGTCAASRGSARCYRCTVVVSSLFDPGRRRAASKWAGSISDRHANESSLLNNEERRGGIDSTDTTQTARGRPAIQRTETVCVGYLRAGATL